MATHNDTKKTDRLFGLVTYAIDNPRSVIRAVSILTLLMSCFLPFASIDVDPENMLAENEPARVYHNEMKRILDINDLIVVGIQNPVNPHGVFNPASLNRIFELSEFAKTITWQDKLHPEKKIGVVTHNILSPNQVDAIDAGGPGVIRFERLMNSSIHTQEEADKILQRGLANPFLAETMISKDRKSMALYIPITSKSVSADVYHRLNAKIETFKGEEKFHITGLPLAEDVFGIDMFVQMAISAPLAMILIFCFIYYFFRNAMVCASALVVAVATVLITMGAFVASGNTIHIMSSMIAIFLMPIAVLDAVHMLSMFFDKYQQSKDRKNTLIDVTRTLFVPMLYTSLTSAAGFFSLYLAPIPPIQVFGIFVGLGILIAWLLTIMLIPAYIMLLKPERLENFGATRTGSDNNVLSKLLFGISSFSTRYAKGLLALGIIVVSTSVFAIQSIKVNDNPMKWLLPDHPIRVADTFINDNFGGNYLVYLAFTPIQQDSDISAIRSELLQKLSMLSRDEAVIQFEEKTSKLSDELHNSDEFVRLLWQFTNEHLTANVHVSSGSMEDDLADIFSSDSPKATQAASNWQAIQTIVSDIRSKREIFKRPDLLTYIAKLQEDVDKMPLVGNSNSLADLVKKLNKELHNSDPAAYQIPEKTDLVSEVLIAFENSHEPFRQWHLTTQDFGTSNMWFQVKSGDNQDIKQVVSRVEHYLKDNPPPLALSHHFFGLSYINIEWQQKMVSGMTEALAGSFVVVLVMMIVLFRSILWGLISMIPLSVTILMIYGVIGLLGKDYDMPVAVLSALALGLSVDFAIHFITHAKELTEETGDWKSALSLLFQEPARAIYRNIIIISFGFTPLLLASLVPYQTVGILMASIMLISGFASLLILPALIHLLDKYLFYRQGSEINLAPEQSFT